MSKVTYSCRHEYPVDEDDGEISRHPEIVIYARDVYATFTFEFAPAGSKGLIGEFKSCLSAGGVSEVPRTFYLGQFTRLTYSTSAITFHLEEEQRNTNDQTRQVLSLPFDTSFVDVMREIASISPA